MKTEKILSELTIRVRQHFRLDNREAIAAVCMSRIGNELSARGNVKNLSIDELSEELFQEIALAE
ncbi:MAG: hypothetical protein K2L14_08190 [Duncaniella sp.]|nr:hypothetical protein [Duncaniella sp.]